MALFFAVIITGVAFLGLSLWAQRRLREAMDRKRRRKCWAVAIAASVISSFSLLFGCVGIVLKWL